MAFYGFTQCNVAPNCNNRQLELVLCTSGGVSVSAAGEGLQPVQVYHPPLPCTSRRSARRSLPRNHYTFWIAVYTILVLSIPDNLQIMEF
ncbi:unnamed protein product [Parnassius apollo]|uniref:(apollo) hypothetical protein n=1 Tax=Parnassius apollo TaxID=110799 RepID=A0A8S3XAH8_PARAO|nr:unnamed protein product [Parnassius apollo]